VRDWVSFAEIKSRVTLAQVLRSYQVDWLRAQRPAANIGGAVRFTGAREGRPSMSIWNAVCFTALLVALEAMCWTW
jgi:hypothetical protein